ncbi:Annexin like [Actinidia chinensis var. chinensis]|uniref:Annexin like n=1 Tax=Actinidia chinensis var. chinensis TaxID=1590841 RepID=A0A2R6RA43_ACTCC|nr:Annexin like [Actinidia chinensis var. chinensis]
MAMRFYDEVDVVVKAFSGFGVDEKSLISILGKWNKDEAKNFRNRTKFFIEDERHFEKWVVDQMDKIKWEFLRFQGAIVLWTMHQWERDAHLINEALIDGPKSYNVLVEIGCTRKSDELFGARKAYHSLYARSIEEDVASIVTGVERKLFVALVSSYRYEGPKVHEETAKSEAKTLYNAVVNAAKKHPIEDEDVVRILSTRSKLHLKSVFKHYKEFSAGKGMEENVEAYPSLIHTVECLSTPHTYFTKVLEEAINLHADEKVKGGLTRVIVTRADVDMKVIKEEYRKKNGGTLINKIEGMANGNFKDFLLTLLARGG